MFQQQHTQSTNLHQTPEVGEITLLDNEVHN
jgi:hypothetical protein